MAMADDLMLANRANYLDNMRAREQFRHPGVCHFAAQATPGLQAGTIHPREQAAPAAPAYHPPENEPEPTEKGPETMAKRAAELRELAMTAKEGREAAMAADIEQFAAEQAAAEGGELAPLLAEAGTV